MARGLCIFALVLVLGAWSIEGRTLLQQQQQQQKPAPNTAPAKAPPAKLPAGRTAPSQQTTFTKVLPMDVKTADPKLTQRLDQARKSGARGAGSFSHFADTMVGGVRGAGRYSRTGFACGVANRCFGESACCSMSGPSWNSCSYGAAQVTSRCLSGFEKVCCDFYDY